MRLSLFREALFILGLVATWEVHATDCPGGLIPAGLTNGVNDVSEGQALFWLDVGRARFGYKAKHYYKLDITSQDSDFPFSEAILSLEEEDPSRGCGTGYFKFDTPHLYRYKDCQNVLLTSKKEPMTDLPPVMWRAPECGCVIVNATVISNGTTYYMDRASSGFLSKRICPRQNRRVSRTKHMRPVKTELPTTTTTTTTATSTTLKPTQQKTFNRAERMDLLCQISLHFNGAELLAREVFLRRRQISGLNLTSLIRTELALDQRKLDIHECCKIVSTSKKTRCFDDMRRRRIDRLCRNGHPDVPFTARRDVFMREKEERCCWRLGESRYHCFAHNSIFKSVSGMNYVDYSLDEMDPVNDIGDYPSEIQEVEMQHNTDYFVDDATQEVIAKGRETVSYTMSTGPVSSTTTATTTAKARVERTIAPRVTRERHPVKSSLFSSVLDDVPRRQTISVKSSATAISAVDAELLALRKRKQKLDLKLTCCSQGKEAGQVFEVATGLYNHCRHQWRKYRKSLKTGRNLCMNKFMECCVDEAGMTSTQAASTAQATSKTLLPATPILQTARGNSQRSIPKGKGRSLRGESVGSNQPTQSIPTSPTQSPFSQQVTSSHPVLKSYSTPAQDMTLSSSSLTTEPLTRMVKAEWTDELEESDKDDEDDSDDAESEEADTGGQKDDSDKEDDADDKEEKESGTGEPGNDKEVTPNVSKNLKIRRGPLRPQKQASSLRSLVKQKRFSRHNVRKSKPDSDPETQPLKQKSKSRKDRKQRRRHRRKRLRHSHHKKLD